MRKLTGGAKGADGPVVRLAVELNVWAMCCGREAHGDSVELRPDKPWRIDPAKWHAQDLPGVEPRVPLTVQRRVYHWDGTRFVATDEPRSKALTACLSISRLFFGVGETSESIARAYQ